MKAVRFHEPGGPEVLRYEDAPEPQLSDEEVLVRVKACAVNRVDIWLRTGLYRTNLPHILGSEFSGEIASVGPGVDKVSVGDKVLVYPGLIDADCKYCIAGEDSLCERVRFLNICRVRSSDIFR